MAIFFSTTCLLLLVALISLGSGVPLTKPAVDKEDGFYSLLWLGGVVPYEIDVAFSEKQQQRILGVISKLNEQPTCITFQPRAKAAESYLKFVKTDSTCLSQWIGSSGDVQSIFLSSNCVFEPYIYWVLLQALGLPAEHKRPDRDYYVTVNWENIDEKHYDDFKKYAFVDPKITAVPYDIHSRLHYPGDKFAKEPGLQTMVATENNGTEELGNEKSPTALDYQKLASLYCSLTTSAPPPTTVNVTTAVKSDAKVTIASDGGSALEPSSANNETQPAVSTQRTTTTPPPLIPSDDIKCECYELPGPFGRCMGFGGSVWKQHDSEACKDRRLNPCWCAVTRDECDETGCAPDVYCTRTCLTSF